MPHPMERAGLPEETSTDTDVFSDAPALGHQDQPQRRAAPRRAIAAVVASAALAAASVEGLLLGSGAHASPFGSAVSGAGQSTQEKSENTGCGNWRRIAYNKATTARDEDACVQSCIDQPGCKYANFQKEKAGENGCNPNYQLQLGACYQFGDECIKSNNPCWSLLTPKADQLKPANFQLVAEDAGCENWESSKIGDVRKVWNPFECSSLCTEEPGCLQFNYQKENSTDPREIEQVGAGACYLFSAVCKTERNVHWDLYAMSNLATTASTTPGAGGTTTA